MNATGALKHDAYTSARNCADAGAATSSSPAAINTSRRRIGMHAVWTWPFTLSSLKVTARPARIAGLPQRQKDRLPAFGPRCPEQRSAPRKVARMRVFTTLVCLIAIAVMCRTVSAATVMFRSDAELIAMSERVVHARVVAQRTERGGPDRDRIYTVTMLS